MKKILILALPLLAAAMAARADLAWNEGFQYPNGNLTNVSAGVWINFSGGTRDMIVTNHILQVSTTGGTVSRSDDDRRPLAVTAGSSLTNTVQPLYASFTVICTNLPNAVGSYFASFYNPKTGTGGGFFGRVQAFTTNTVVPNTWRLGVTANGAAANPLDGGYPVDLALNTPYQVVEQLDPVTLQAATIWVNPVDVNDAFSTDVHYTSSDSIGAATTFPVTDYSFRQASSFGNGFWVITNLTLATTFAEAATNVWSTNAVAPVVVYQPASLIDFPSANISISAVVNGQGLGSMVYQWQESATPDNASPSYVSNPNGNSNIFAINNAQTTDSGYYSLIATTPYGLSVTSTVANVSIVDGPFPPVFLVKPASQTAYRGQTVTLSTTVKSPPSGDPVTFTWYSNNVAVFTQNDNSRSSSYVLNNVITNYSATYTVAVSNNYGGVVSGNAVLTVLNPAQVTVAFLRKLVSPSTFLATNVPPTIPYAVTGIVTTLTNITTGNTASYYLQDGTAGINIFVTGGSTFRPALGDVVTFTGVLSSFTSGLELYADINDNSTFPYTSFTDWSNNIAALPAPQVIPYTILNSASNANYNLGGRYVQISDVYFGALGGSTISNTVNQTIVITNSIGQSFNLFFPYLSLDVAGQTLPSYAYTVNGIVYSANSIVTNTLLVTRFADINSTVPLPIPLKVSNSGGNLTFNWSSGAAGAGFSLQSSDIVTGPYTTIDGATPGFTTNTLSAPTLFFRLYHP